MNWTPIQLFYLDELREMCEMRGHNPSENFIYKMCEAFGGHFLTSFWGIGSTRLVISHPEKEGMVLKIAFQEEGIQGNLDEHRLYHAASDAVKKRLAVPGNLLEDGFILEMEYCETIPEDEFEEWQEQVQEIEEMIDFVHYKDPVYGSNFGINSEGTLVAIDYGETEEFVEKPL